MNHVILAAGKGSRLLPITQFVPKVLLDLNGKDTLLDFQIRSALQLQNLEKIFVVAGYHAQEVQTHLEQLFPDAPIEVAFNPEFQLDNPLLSLACVLPELGNDFLITNGDTYFAQSIFTKMAETSLPLALGVSRRELHHTNDMLVTTTRDRLFLVRRGLQTESAKFESAGIARVQGTEAAAAFRQAVETMISRFGHERHIWHDVLNKANLFFPVRILDLENDDWFEVDNAQDLMTLRNALALV